jgi:hypothetical protein
MRYLKAGGVKKSSPTMVTRSNYPQLQLAGTRVRVTIPAAATIRARAAPVITPYHVRACASDRFIAMKLQ